MLSASVSAIALAEVDRRAVVKDDVAVRARRARSLRRAARSCGSGTNAMVERLVDVGGDRLAGDRRSSAPATAASRPSARTVSPFARQRDMRFQPVERPSSPSRWAIAARSLVIGHQFEPLAVADLVDAELMGEIVGQSILPCASASSRSSLEPLPKSLAARRARMAAARRRRASSLIQAALRRLRPSRAASSRGSRHSSDPAARAIRPACEPSCPAPDRRAQARDAPIPSPR